MIKNYLTTALRNVLRHKGFSIINIFGLSLSISVCMLIIVVILDQISYDDVHTKGDRIYRITSSNLLSTKSIGLYASTNIQIGEEIAKRHPKVEKYVTLSSRISGDAKYKESTVPIQAYTASEEFFNVFDFPLTGGARNEVLREPFSLVLTQAEAKRHFGDEDPIGKYLSIDEYGEFKVTGIIPEFKFKTHIQFDALVSISTIEPLIQQEVFYEDYYEWDDSWSNWNYVLLTEGTDPDELYSYFDEITEEYFKDNDDYKLQYRFQTLDEIVPGPIISNELGESLPKVFVIFLAGLALVVIISASFNYTSLSIARSLLRAKEVGVRKTMGAKKRQIIWQFLVEAIIISIISSLVAFVLLQFLLPGFTGMKLMSLLEIRPEQNLAVYMWFFLFALFTGLISGLLPALFISAFNPIKVLKGVSNVKLFSKVTLRKILLAFQFVFSMIFLITIILIFRQFNFMVNAEMGFDRGAVYNIDTKGHDLSKLKDHFSSIPEVQLISASTHAPGTGSSRGIHIRRNIEDEEISMSRFDCDHNYIEVMGLELIAGSNFEKDLNNGESIIINQKALPVLNFETPEDALGESVYLWDSTLVQIVGVVKDYKFRALFLESGPLVLRNRDKYCRLLSMRLMTKDMSATLAKIESEWEKIDEIHEIDAQFLDDKIRENYSYFEDVLYTVGFTSILAIIIACLGLLGMATYSTQIKTKEIGVRKVFGAKPGSVVRVILKPYIWLLSISAVIAAPLGYLINDLWLQYLANKVSINALNLAGGVVIILVIAVITISSQTLRAANINPAESLRYE